MRLKRLKQMFENWKVSAIFAVLNTKDVPWAQAVEAGPLDLDYMGNFSGSKIVSNLVESLLGEDEDATLTPADLSMLCDIIVALYGTKWGKLWDTMGFDYNPIENYSMVETMTDDETVTEYGKTHTRTDNLQHQRTDNLSSQRTDNLTHEKDGTETETPNTTTQDDNRVFGFNSENAVPSDSRTIENTGTNEKEYDLIERDTGTQTQLNTGTQTEADTGTQTQLNTGTQTEADTGTQTQLNTGTQTEADTGTQTSEDGGADTSTRNYRLTRAGNIGVTTSQQMIEAERNLWRLWDFFRGVVYPDIDRVLTIEIY